MLQRVFASGEGELFDWGGIILKTGVRFYYFGRWADGEVWVWFVCWAWVVLLGIKNQGSVCL